MARANALAYHVRMRRVTGSRALWLVGALIGLITALAVTVESTPMLDGRPFRLEMEMLSTQGTSARPGYALLLMALQTVVALLLFATPFLIIIELLTPEGRRRLVRYAIFLVTLVLLLRWMGPSLAQINARGFGPAAEAARPAAPESDDLIPVELPPPPPSDTVVLAVTAGIALLCALGAAWLFTRKREPHTSDTPMLDFGKSAQSAIDALRDGAALGETIQRCYFDMCHEVATQQGINRRTAMTPTEFEHTLTERGLPRGAVHTLTSLFEQARYGGIQASEREKRMAIESLEAIISACKRDAHKQPRTATA
jgi:hypothetical protein